jgi:UDP-N-acetylglucosamine transferase subunit ALG13
MIFCVTGNAHQPFDRLINLSVSISKILGEELIIQNGSCIYSQASQYLQIGVLGHEKFIEAVCRSNFVITHAGAGTLRTLNSHKIKSISIPRLSVYAEHVNDHQVQIAKEFMGRGITFLPADYQGQIISAENSYQQFCAMSFLFGDLSTQDLNEEIADIVRKIIGH